MQRDHWPVFSVTSPSEGGGFCRHWVNIPTCGSPCRTTINGLQSTFCFFYCQEVIVRKALYQLGLWPQAFNTAPQELSHLASLLLPGSRRSRCPSTLLTWLLLYPLGSTYASYPTAAALDLQGGKPVDLRESYGPFQFQPRSDQQKGAQPKQCPLIYFSLCPRGAREGPGIRLYLPACNFYFVYTSSFPSTQFISLGHFSV